MSEESTVQEVEAPAKPEKITQNGITRPKAGTATGRVWEITDELSEAAGEPAVRKDVLAKAEAEKINPATAATQYGRWRTFHGLKNVKKAVQAKEKDSTEEENTED